MRSLTTLCIIVALWILFLDKSDCTCTGPTLSYPGQQLCEQVEITDLDSRSSLVLHVRGRSYFGLGLASSSNHLGPARMVWLGRQSNSICSIIDFSTCGNLYRSYTTLTDSYQANTLSVTEFRSFWVTWDAVTVSVGKGGQPGSDQMMTYTYDEAVTVTAVFTSGAGGYEYDVIFDAPFPAYTCPAQLTTPAVIAATTAEVTTETTVETTTEATVETTTEATVETTTGTKADASTERRTGEPTETTAGTAIGATTATETDVSTETQAGTVQQTPTTETQTGNDPQTPTTETQTGNVPQTPTTETQTGNDPQTPTTETQTGADPQTPTTETQTGADPQTPTTETQTGTDPQTPTTETQTGADPQTPTTETQTGADPQTPTTETQTGNDPQTPTTETQTGADPQTPTTETQTGTDPQTPTTETFGDQTDATAASADQTSSAGVTGTSSATANNSVSTTADSTGATQVTQGTTRDNSAASTPTPLELSSPEHRCCSCMKNELPSTDAAGETAEAERRRIQITDELWLPPAGLSASVRKKSSAPDNRKSASIMGYVGAVICLIPAFLVVATDLLNVMRNAYASGDDTTER